DGSFYISMEYVNGASLSAILREDVLVEAPRAVPLLCQLAAAVEHAHARGVLHRDLKPGNLMVVEMRGAEDLLKVLDFGIAKIISPGYAESIAVSQEGIVFGTPFYMAPEHLESQVTDPRSDIYAMGCIAYELLTGEPPFTGAVHEVMHAHAMAEPIPPSKRTPSVPSALDDVILRCLAKRPEDRYQSAGELLEELTRLRPRYRSEERRVGKEGGRGGAPWT